MAPPALRLATTNDPLVDGVLRDLRTDLQALLGAPFLRGVRLDAVAVGPGAVTILHGLGRQPVGYLVTRATGAVSWVSWDDKRLTLAASVSSVVDLWVF